MTDFSKMSSNDQQALLKKVGDVLVRCNLGYINIKITKEKVCDLKRKSIKNNATLIINEYLSSSESESVDLFNVKINPVIRGIQNVDVKLGMKPMVGGLYKTIKNVMPLKENSAIDLEHIDGEVWLIHFWSSTSQPCDWMIEQNKKMLSKRSHKWNVRVIEISIDKIKDFIYKYSEDKGWLSLELYHIHKSDCCDVYGVKKGDVPIVILIDKNGKIAFQGHPELRADLEKDLDNLINGNTLTGRGKGNYKANELERYQTYNDRIPKDFRKLDFDGVFEEIRNICLIFERLIKDKKISELTRGFSKALCFIVLQMSYSPIKSACYGKFKNYRVLIGPIYDLESILDIFKEEIKGTFEVINTVKGIRGGDTG